MSKNFVDCKKEVIDVFIQCLAYLHVQKLKKPLFFGSTQSEEELIQRIEDTLELFAPELVKEANHE